ncbi:MAG TPA: CaiB/BaiF CoA-transferase family protein [Solirubrobacteraceae bacterium]|nr:CaiB/BaiF CoA-transferase family protein [Solirubrobacteraceae bacterium]
MGPLAGIRVLEIGGIGPNPFAGMLLADMGADVLRIDRPGGQLGLPAGTDPTLRSRQTLRMDLKTGAAREAVLTLAERADALIEGFRPGAMERLGLGPVELHARNPRLVYGRMTGYGQVGPMASVAGHDINYIALAGALGASRRRGERPMFALNLVGDYGGGAMFLAFGVVCALLEARRSGQGQVVDAAMVDGAALLTALIHGLHAAGAWDDEPGTNLLDSGAHFYEVYATADGGHVAVGALEPQFYARLLELLEIPPGEMPQFDRDRWPEFKQRLEEIFATRSTDQWAELFEPEDACVTAVRGLFDAGRHPHLLARQTFIELEGVQQPGPAPRFSRTAAEATAAGRDVEAALGSWELSAGQREVVAGALAAPGPAP